MVYVCKHCSKTYLLENTETLHYITCSCGSTEFSILKDEEINKMDPVDMNYGLATIPGKKYSKSEDVMVSHPPHYQSKTGLEVIDVIKAFTNGLTGIEATDTGNVIKYICRWKHKNGIQDLKKARWYIDHLIKEVEEGEKNNG